MGDPDHYLTGWYRRQWFGEDIHKVDAGDVCQRCLIVAQAWANQLMD